MGGSHATPALLYAIRTHYILVIYGLIIYLYATHALLHTIKDTWEADMRRARNHVQYAVLFKMIFI
jgi:hypothetical protein